MDPRRRPVIIGELDAGALAGPARRGSPVSPIEEQFGCLMQDEHADRAVETRHGFAANADLGAARAHQQRRRAFRRRRIAGHFGQVVLRASLL